MPHTSKKPSYAPKPGHPGKIKNLPLRPAPQPKGKPKKGKP